MSDERDVCIEFEEVTYSNGKTEQIQIGVYPRPEAQTRERDLDAALSVILDAIDYTKGACRVNEMVGAVLPEALIVNARKALLK